MKNIYNSPLAEMSTQLERGRLAQKLAKAGQLQRDGAAVESLSSEAADLRLEGQYRWGENYSTMLAMELDELSDSSLPALPLYRPEGSYENAGYYEIESADVEPLHANRRDVWQFSLSLTSVGGRASHFRTVLPNPSQVDHDEQWGNDLTEIVGIPSTVSKVRWFDADSSTVAAASSVGTCSGQNIDIDEYDLDDGRSALGLADDATPTLIYDVNYHDDARAGVRAYDTRGYDAKFANSGYGPRQWQTIHSTRHDIDDPIVISNGCLRLELDEAAGTITAETWDSSTSSWSAVGLTNNSSWSLLDVDLTHVGMVRVDAQLTFSDGSSLFALDAILGRGADAVLFDNPQADDGEPIPQGLLDWLDPIAASTVVATGETKGLVDRQEVRR
jgi:hypothetical protein